MAHIRKATGVWDWFDQRLAVTKFFKVMVSEYWIPKNISFLWAMGVILMTLFIVLFVSGLMLVMYYKPDVNLAFDSVNFTIMKEVEYGWLASYPRSIGISCIFDLIHSYFSSYLLPLV